MKIFVIIISVLIQYPLLAQEFQNTVSITDEENFVSPNASIEDVAWIQGYWKGEAFGGISEEVWTPPLGGSMNCIYKSVVDGKVNFYEMLSIMEENGSLVLKLKHFNPDMTGWEEKNKTIDFPLVKIESKKAYFSGFTFERVDADHLNVYVIFKDKDGNRKETKFPFTRGDFNASTMKK